MIQSLSDVMPIILIVVLVLMYNLERWLPYLAKPADKKSHDRQNFILNIISFTINGGLSLAVTGMLIWTEKNQWGLLNYIQLPDWADVIIGILLVDFGGYIFHNISHRVPFLWRIHRVHHSDFYLNASSSLRFHPLDTVFSQGLVPCFWIPLMGISLTSFILYGTLALPLLIIQHSNFKLPDGIEKYGRLIFATPGWHKIHHSNEQPLTDSHYGDVFTFWDRIFGTWKPIQPDQIRYGLKEFDHPAKHRAWYLIRSPFLDINKPV